MSMTGSVATPGKQEQSTDTNIPTPSKLKPFSDRIPSNSDTFSVCKL